jgi:N-acetylneuraminic acid mutarotase
MNVARAGHGAALLPDGRVIVAGGDPSGKAVEIYDSALDTWTSAASFQTVHSPPSLAVLADGSVLAAGGNDTSKSTEVYFPPFDIWVKVGDMTRTRSCCASMTLLQDGRILLVGGAWNAGGGYLFIWNQAEVFDPSTRAWSPVGGMSTPRASHTAVQLSDGTVLVAGGRTNNSPLVITASAEVYDTVRSQWVATGSMTTLREGHAAILLDSGQVLAVGGGNPGALATAELYDGPQAAADHLD